MERSIRRRRLSLFSAVLGLAALACNFAGGTTPTAIPPTASLAPTAGPTAALPSSLTRLEGFGVIGEPQTLSLRVNTIGDIFLAPLCFSPTECAQPLPVASPVLIRFQFLPCGLTVTVTDDVGREYAADQTPDAYKTLYFVMAAGRAAVLRLTPNAACYLAGVYQVEVVANSALILTSTPLPTHTPRPRGPTPTAVPDQPTETPGPIPTAEPTEDLTPQVGVFLDQESISVGQCATLSWFGVNVSRLTINGSVVPPAGEMSVCPPGDITYEIVGEYAGGQIRSSVFLAAR